MEYYGYHCPDEDRYYAGLEKLLTAGKPVIVTHPETFGVNLNRVSPACLLEINNAKVWQYNWRTYFTPTSNVSALSSVRTRTRLTSSARAWPGRLPRNSGSQKLLYFSSVRFLQACLVEDVRLLRHVVEAPIASQALLRFHIPDLCRLLEVHL